MPCCATLCCRRVLPGLILKGLAAVLPAQLLQQAPSTALCNGSSSSRIGPSLLLELRGCAREELSAAVAGPMYRSGHQDVPVDLQAAPPLYWPTERVRGNTYTQAQTTPVAGSNGIRIPSQPVCCVCFHRGQWGASTCIKRLRERYGLWVCCSLGRPGHSSTDATPLF